MLRGESAQNFLYADLEFLYADLENLYADLESSYADLETFKRNVKFYVGTTFKLGKHPHFQIQKSLAFLHHDSCEQLRGCVRSRRETPSTSPATLKGLSKVSLRSL